MPNRFRIVLAAFAFIPLSTLTFATTPVDYSYRVVNSYPHSDSVFTQGLEFHNGLLYEGSGQRGESQVLVRRLESNTPVMHHPLNKRLFGEGITILQGKLYQLTWKSRRGFIYQADTLQATGEFSIATDGWGLCNNGQQLIYSDGSAQLRFLNPKGFSVEKTLTVTLNGQAIHHINELEWVNGLIYANIWQSNWIVMINPNNGHIVGRVRLHDLLDKALKTTRTDVLNGIAYDEEEQRLLVTGKYWPKLYHIKLLPQKPKLRFK